MKNVINTLKELNNFMKENSISAEASYRSELSHMVRCGRSQISLNVSNQRDKFYLEVQKEKKQISASISLSPTELDPLKALALELKEKVKFMPDKPHVKDLKAIAKGDFPYTPPDEQVANFDSEKMVDLYEEVVNRFKDKNVEVSGAFSAGSYSYATINTLTQEPVNYSGADFNGDVVLQLLDHDKKEIKAQCVGENFADYDPKKIISELEENYKIKTSTKRVDLTPDVYDVVFYAPAFADMTMYMGYITLLGSSYEYQVGMLQKDNHKIGDKIFSDKLNIIDDPKSDLTLYNRLVGRNGIKRERFPYIEKGILKNLAYTDKDTCDRFNKEMNTDYNCSSILIEKGDGPSSFSEMLKCCKKKTVFISELHYMNFTNQTKGEFTCTSRFGTYLIENGEIKNHLFNVRINDSYHRIFNSIEWLSSSYKHINASNSYAMREASAFTSPMFAKINGVKITGSSGTSK